MTLSKSQYEVLSSIRNRGDVKYRDFNPVTIRALVRAGLVVYAGKPDCCYILTAPGKRAAEHGDFLRSWKRKRK